MDNYTKAALLHSAVNAGFVLAALIISALLIQSTFLLIVFVVLYIMSVAAGGLFLPYSATFKERVDTVERYNLRNQLIKELGARNHTDSVYPLHTEVWLDWFLTEPYRVYQERCGAPPVGWENAQQMGEKLRALAQTSSVSASDLRKLDETITLYLQRAVAYRKLEQVVYDSSGLRDLNKQLERIQAALNNTALRDSVRLQLQTEQRSLQQSAAYLKSLPDELLLLEVRLATMHINFMQLVSRLTQPQNLEDSQYLSEAIAQLADADQVAQEVDAVAAFRTRHADKLSQVLAPQPVASTADPKMKAFHNEMLDIAKKTEVELNNTPKHPKKMQRNS